MKITNQLRLPQPFVSAVEREHEYKSKRYSVTSIQKGVRETLLLRRHDNEITQDVADMIWLIFGTAVHSILEQSQETASQLKETYLVEQVGDYELSGIFDLYDDSTGTVTDYKTASVWKVIYNEWDDYKQQVLMYCWLLRKAGFNAHRGEIVAILKDHSKRDAETKVDYPLFPVFSISWDFGEQDFQEIDQFIRDKFDQIKACEGLPDKELPLCSPEERWTKPTVYAVTKIGNKKAKRLFEDVSEAESYAAYISELEDKDYVIIERPGEDVKCLKYCSAREFCDHYKELKCQMQL